MEAMYPQIQLKKDVKQITINKRLKNLTSGQLSGFNSLSFNYFTNLCFKSLEKEATKNIFNIFKTEPAI